jgi:hypothetical protein
VADTGITRLLLGEGFDDASPDTDAGVGTADDDFAAADVGDSFFATIVKLSRTFALAPPAGFFFFFFLPDVDDDDDDVVEMICWKKLRKPPWISAEFQCSRFDVLSFSIFTASPRWMSRRAWSER